MHALLVAHTHGIAYDNSRALATLLCKAAASPAECSHASWSLLTQSLSGSLAPIQHPRPTHSCLIFLPWQAESLLPSPQNGHLHQLSASRHPLLLYKARRSCTELKKHFVQQYPVQHEGTHAMRTSSWYWQLQKRLSTAARLLNQNSWINLECSSRQLQHGSIVCSQASLSPLGHCLHHTCLQAQEAC